MANTKTKIERMGYDKDVQDMLASGDYPTAAAIAKQLCKTHNIDIHDSTVQRYIKKIKKDVAPDAARHFRQHINRELPKDLEALENIQRQAQAWWTEEPVGIVERLARIYVEAKARIKGFYQRLINADLANPGKKKITVKGVVNEVVNLFAKDMRPKKKRMEAMKMESDAVKIKLVNAGALDKKSRGHIFLVDRRGEYKKPDGTTGHVPFDVVVAVAAVGKHLVFDLSPTQSMFVFSGYEVVMLKGPMEEGKICAAMAGLINNSRHCYEYNSSLCRIRGALVRDTHQNINTSTVPDIFEEFGDFVSFKGNFKKIVIDCRPLLIEMDFFGIDDPASLSILQGPQYAVIWLEEPAPIQKKANAGLPKGVFNLAIARAVRQKGTLPRAQVTQDPADEDLWTEEVANGPAILSMDPKTGAQIRLAVFCMQPGEKKHANALMRAGNMAAFKDDSGEYTRYVEGRAAAVSKGRPVLHAYEAKRHYAGYELPVVPGVLGVRFFDAWHHPAGINGQFVRPGELLVHHACQMEGGDAPILVESQVLPLLVTPKYREKIKEWCDMGEPSRRQPDQSNKSVVTARVIEGLLKTRLEPGPTLQKCRFGPTNQARQLNLPASSGPLILISKTADNLHRACNGGWHWKIDNSGNVVGATLVKTDPAADLGDALSYGASRLFPYVRVYRRTGSPATSKTCIMRISGGRFQRPPARDGTRSPFHPLRYGAVLSRLNRTRSTVASWHTYPSNSMRFSR